MSKLERMTNDEKHEERVGLHSVIRTSLFLQHSSFGFRHSLPFLRHSTFDIRHSYCAMLDIRLIREKPDFVRERLATRGAGDEAKIDEVLRVDAERRKLETALQQLNADRKRLSKEIGGKKSRGETTDEVEQHVRQIGEQIAELNARATAAEDEQKNLVLQIANLPHKSVPTGKDPGANRVVRSWGEKPRLTKPADH